MLANVTDTHQAPGETQAPDAIAREIALRMRGRRKELHLSQSALAEQSGVSLGSLKRFESDYLISLESLIKLSLVLKCEDGFSDLFSAQEEAASLEDIVAQGHLLLDRIALMSK